jgi:hypothetical protein
MAAVMEANSSLIAQLEAEARAEAALEALSSVVATLQPGRYMAAAVTATSSLSATAEPEVRFRARLDVAARPSAEDIAQAVLNTFIVESGMSASDVLRILLAVAAGKTDIAAGPPVIVTFRDRADTRNRVRAEMTGSERGAVTVDGGA